jgi:hypothetical protein
MGFWRFFGVGVALVIAPPIGLILLAVAVGIPRRRGEVSSVHSRRSRAMGGAGRVPDAAPPPPPGVWTKPEAYLSGLTSLQPDTDADSSS